ncbi:two-component system response regulator [Spiribacter halobius]|uniref:Diguanylate cyclase n=1 Tax=Sediminicurvatus halobius TaxID=2182432 RepID=A0A2U2N984_9GAMM|nr:EAL domain-containing protein [Spiribacter halobius]PWG65735.1 diguanylate cyclase [Spiribacter halobius]UEX77770.1 EAL domain-containing protein [Spiribacter halobius]
MLHVFVVDDQNTNRKLLAKLAGSLRPAVRVHEFASPLQALDAAATAAPDLVVTDYVMPEMTGAELVRALRAIPECIELPVIVVTAYGDREYRYDALAAGATDFLLSPVDHAEFKARAGNLLVLRRQQRIIRRRAALLEARLSSRTRLQEEELRHSEEKLRLVVNTVPAMVSAIDPQGRCVYINNRQGVFFGVDPEIAAGQPLDRVFDADYAQRHQALNATILQERSGIQDIEERLADTHGREHVFLTTKAPLYSVNDSISSIVTISVDITERKELESSLWNQAHYDALTGLPNRSLLHDRLTHALTRVHREHALLGVFYVDLDGFKDINDAYGHSVGDQVLRASAERLGQRVRAADTLARLGGDELVAVVEGMRSADEADTFASKLLDALRDPLPAAGLRFQLRASIGIALSYDGQESPESILSQADAALYDAKAQGGNQWAYYTPALTARAQRRIQLEGALRHALDQDLAQLGLAVQPIRTLEGDVLGHEALVRWEHPVDGWVPPHEFLAVAESTGLMSELGRLMLTAATQWAMREDAGRIAVNVSPEELAAQGFTATCLGILERTGLPPQRLELEITEGGLMRQDEATLHRLDSLRRRGVSIAIDDFGTGYSSLQYIKALPVDRLKIDRSFIAGLAGDADNRAIVAAALTVAQHFGLEVVAEGVESAADAEALAQIGVREMQGFHCGRPTLVARFSELL